MISTHYIFVTWGCKELQGVTTIQSIRKDDSRKIATTFSQKKKSSDD